MKFFKLNLLKYNLSKTVTLYPFETKASARFDPMKPPPPKIIQFLFLFFLFKFTSFERCMNKKIFYPGQLFFVLI